MNSLGIKNQIIKEVITPFLKNNGFTKKGIKYFKEIHYCKIEADIQSQRYYTDDDVKNFRINVYLYYKNFFESNNCCGGFIIPRETSWILINENTNIDELKNWLKNELEKLLEYIDEFNDIKRIVDVAKANDNGLFYSFLLRENKMEKELEIWIQETKQQIEQMENELQKLNNEKSLLEKKEESLDKEIKLKGLKMMINERERKVENKKNVLEKIV